MSTIIAVSKNRKTVIACDSADYVGSTRCHSAVFPGKVLSVVGSFIACAGFTVYRNILAHYLRQGAVRPRLADEGQVLEFFLKFWRAMKEDYHFVNDSSDVNSPSPFADLGAEFIVANSAGIFKVKEILSVSRFTSYCAIGSGASHAEGALHVAYGRFSTAREVATAAMDAALAFDAASGGEVMIYEVPSSRKARRGPADGTAP